MAVTPKILLLSEKTYRKLLRVYPKPHRSEYGGLMAQLFRDQCRDAYCGSGTRGVLKLWLRVLVDTGSSCLIERTTEIERNPMMKYSSAAKNPTVYMIAGLVLGLISFAPFVLQSAVLFQAVVFSSSVAILIKALVELSRPSSEMWKVGARTFVLMFLFALYMPAWAKLNVSRGMSPEAHRFFGIFVTACLFSNPLVFAVKLLQRLLSRNGGTPSQPAT
jgi:hypothetical protein